MRRFVSLQGVRSLFTSSHRLAPDVAVPSMGDSITEGTICAVLKGPGDCVAVDETMFQIETDKVTIDVKSPCSGTVDSVNVKEEDTVIVGQVVAAVSAGEAGAAGSPAAPSMAEGSSTGDAEVATVTAAVAENARKPGLKFPPRLTADGRRISALPAAEAMAVLASMTAGSVATKPDPSSGGAPSAAAAGAPMDVEILDQHPPRRPLSELEMELIMLGGASP